MPQILAFVVIDCSDLRFHTLWKHEPTHLLYASHRLVMVRLSPPFVWSDLEALTNGDDEHYSPSLRLSVSQRHYAHLSPRCDVTFVWNTR
jgi:hypothetical protein